MAVDPCTDAEIIRSSLADAPRFATIFDRHAATLFRFLVRRVGRDTADELLGETFRIAFERRAVYDCDHANARPWLYGIATNLVARHRRTEARRLRATARLSVDRSGDAGDTAVTSVIDALDALGDWPTVADGIADLPDGERDALLLYAWEELSYEEIAIALTIPIGTVRSRLNRARKKLRELVPARGEHTERAAP